MEDNECFIKYIEIVPLDSFNNCSDVTLSTFMFPAVLPTE